MNKLLLLLNYYCATHATSCLCKRIPLLCWIEVVVVWLILVVSGTREKTAYLCQKSVNTMKNQVQLVCSPKHKIWLWTDKLQRCCWLPLVQAKLRQIERWYVAESLCYRLHCKINHVLISQRHESRRRWPIFSVRISTISTRMDLSFARPLHV